MSKFFPIGLKLDDTQSPMEILQVAQHDWETESDGLLTLVLQATKSKSDNDMILVHAKHLPSNRTVSLFSVIYRPGNSYPVTIQPRDEEMPKFLRKSYDEPGLRSLGVLAAAATIQGQTVTNKWVSETPSEFRSKLFDVFNLGLVKSEVLNLVCVTPEAGNEEPSLSELQVDKE